MYLMMYVWIGLFELLVRTYIPTGSTYVVTIIHTAKCDPQTCQKYIEFFFVMIGVVHYEKRQHSR